MECLSCRVRERSGGRRELSRAKSLQGRKLSILLPMQPDQEIINRWSGSAPFWEKHSEIIRQMFAPITQALVEDAQVGSRQAVLDIAMGPGEPALSVAALVGPEGRIFGIDPIPEMVAAARRAADRLGLKNAQFDVAFADHLPFPADTFDAVISRFGVMFFPSPVDAVREMLRVLKPGRKLALAVWHFAERNPFHYTLSRVIDRYVESPPLAPDAPDAFRFATSWQVSGGSYRGRRDSSHPSAFSNSPYKRRSRWKSFGRCDARCLRSFGKRSPRFPRSR